jgi:hypothetical protein
MNWEGRGNDRSVTEDIILTLAAGTKKSHENRSQESRCPYEIRNGHLPITISYINFKN